MLTRSFHIKLQQKIHLAYYQCYCYCYRYAIAIATAMLLLEKIG